MAARLWIHYLLMLTPGYLSGYFQELGALIDATPAGPTPNPELGSIPAWARVATERRAGVNPTCQSTVAGDCSGGRPVDRAG